MRAGGQRLTAMHRADRYNDRNVADFQMPHSMLNGDGQNIVLIRRLLSTSPQHINRAGVLGVIEREDPRAVVLVAHRTHKQCDTADLGS